MSIAAGADLERLAALVRNQPAVRALDLGCGAGHAAYALARGGARRVVAYDPSQEMLSVVAEQASTRGHEALETVVGAAERLPFDAGSFDLVVTRYSAHQEDCDRFSDVDREDWYPGGPNFCITFRFSVLAA